MTMDIYGHLFENAEEDVSMFQKLETDLMAALHSVGISISRCAFTERSQGKAASSPW
ncbi:hypothetical protein [Salipiger mangrovisoli]|uniref:hypothetical protein n=1 Tax=Salipiger mangrovisoli TaxID=2865933 RepID=UPI001F11DC5A|nr:hypothetical protein [Salipiger mangrovisoli]